MMPCRNSSVAYRHDGDFFKLTPTEGPSTGETFTHFPIAEGDHVLADRGYSTAVGLDHVICAGGHVTVRVNTAALPFHTTDGAPFDLLVHVATLKRTGSVGAWAALATGDGIVVPGRVCAIRKTQEAIAMAQRKLRRKPHAEASSLNRVRSNSREPSSPNFPSLE